MRASVLLTFLFGVSGFLASLALRSDSNTRVLDSAAAVVLPAALQTILYGGDRFLAADIETVRTVVSIGGMRPDEADFRARAHLVVSQLNSCHEDNYWIGNAELTWGGGHSEGLRLLRNATRCRFWDPWPAFFYGFNTYFFNRNVEEARIALEVAARRADAKTGAAFRNFSVSLLAGQIEDERLAVDLVRRERDQTEDARLRALLDQRARRLEGLVILREARRRFEARAGRALAYPEELIDYALLDSFPEDPMKLGYEFKNGEFHLRRLRHEGLESLR